MLNKYVNIKQSSLSELNLKMTSKHVNLLAIHELLTKMKELCLNKPPYKTTLRKFRDSILKELPSDNLNHLKMQP